MKHEPHFDAVSEMADADVCATLNVVIAYDDVPAGQHAMHILADVAANFGDTLELRPQLWRFQFLEDPDWGNGPRGLRIYDGGMRITRFP